MCRAFVEFLFAKHIPYIDRNIITSLIKKFRSQTNSYSTQLCFAQ